VSAEWRCLTVRPPWAWATSVEGDEGKGVENRSTNTYWRDWVGVHSGKQWSLRGATDQRITDLVDRRAALGVDVEEPGSVIVTIARIVDSHLDEGCCRPWGESDYTHADGRQVRAVWHWVLADRRRVDPPLAVPRGYQGLWIPDADLAGELDRLRKVGRGT